MDNLNDLKKIWLTADTTTLPKSAEIMQMGKRFRNQKLRKKIFLIAASLISTCLMVAVMFFYKSVMLTTRLGEVCIIISSLILVYTNTSSIGRFYRYKDYNNKEFIKFLEQTRLNQLRYYKKTQVIALLFYCPGLLLYLFEMVHDSLVFSIITYTLTIAALVLMGVYVRPRTYKKQTLKLSATIEKLEKLSEQL